MRLEALEADEGVGRGPGGPPYKAPMWGGCYDADRPARTPGGVSRKDAKAPRAETQSAPRGI